ncbi:MAG: orotidine 5'-phosphate decarboxylase / HUMPS family protein [Sulfolobales archaeon]|nr:orotidine 5'-phosphate decarboxylase [Sulfolobales archaeon]MCX8209030.1 orotidine 5'-phosphate decarboxylase [Sulfolobales archaeon]MDW8010061.1 orotidine 5'-phosphate decarboxylase / HUMPS family protein [Sulfolobales archaeon]
MKIRDLKLPALQVALDFTSVEQALRILSEIRDLDLGIVEVGTPLIKSEGMKSVSEIRNFVERTPVLADTKTVDAGALEAELAIRSGADFMTVLALADNVVVESAVRTSRSLGGDVVADFIGFRGDVVTRARELAEIGVEAVNVHVGIDVQRSLGFTAAGLRDTVRILSKEVSELILSVSGGIKPEDIPVLLDAGAQIVVVGGAITRSRSPRQVAEMCAKALRHFPR